MLQNRQVKKKIKNKKTQDQLKVKRLMEIPKELKVYYKEKHRLFHTIPFEEQKYRNIYQDQILFSSLRDHSYNYPELTNLYKKHKLLSNFGIDPIADIEMIFSLDISIIRKLNYLISYLSFLHQVLEKENKFLFMGYKRVILRMIDYLVRMLVTAEDMARPRITYMGTATDAIEWIDKLEKKGIIAPLKPKQIAQLFSYKTTPTSRAKPLDYGYVKTARYQKNITLKGSD